MRFPVDIEPEATGVFLTLSILKEVVFVVDQLRVDEAPLLIVEGLAVKVQVGSLALEHWPSQVAVVYEPFGSKAQLPLELQEYFV